MKTTKRWIPFAFLICCFCGLVYVAVQQSYRQSANDPQIQIAEDSAAMLASGAQVETVVSPGAIDIETSLAPYVVIYNAAGQPIAGNGLLNHALPTLPSGVFDRVRTGGEDRVTWQPETGVRSAIVVTSIGADGGFVMAGRSLREVEARENALTVEVGLIFIFALIGSFLLMAALESSAR